MAIVSPSILAADFAHLAQSCAGLVSPQSPRLHFDVMDGVFVPNISVGPLVLASLKKALPAAVYDVHLMVSQPGKHLKAFADVGAGCVTFHLEAAGQATPALLAATRALGCKAGLAINPGTDIADVFPYLALLDLVLVMSVQPGFGGQSFMPAARGRIGQLHRQLLSQNLAGCVQVQVDGGITDKTAPACVAAGADILVAGSYIFNAKSPAKALQSLRNIER